MLNKKQVSQFSEEEMIEWADKTNEIIRFLYADGAISVDKAMVMEEFVNFACIVIDSE